MIDVEIVCPACKRSGHISYIGKVEDITKIDETEIKCARCKTTYPVIHGIPIIVLPENRNPRNLPSTRPPNEFIEYETQSTKRTSQIIRRYSTGVSLDVGCGKGPHNDYFNGDIVLCDINYHFVYEALNRWSSDYSAYGIVADAVNLPFSNDSFDFVFCSNMLEHLSPQYIEHTITSLIGITKEFLVVEVPNQGIFSIVLRSALTKMGVYSQTSYDDSTLEHHTDFNIGMLKSYGFKVRGCIGWVTRERLRIGFLWDIYDLITWHIPAFSGTLIGIFRKEPNSRNSDSIIDNHKF